MEFIVIKMLTLSRSVSSLVDELLSVPSASCYPLKTELNDGVYDIAIAVIQCTVRPIYTYKFWYPHIFLNLSLTDDTCLNWAPERGESYIERLCTDDASFALPVAPVKLIHSPRNHCRCLTIGVGSNLHGTEVLLCGRTAFINYSFTSIMTDPYQSPMVLLPTDSPLTAAADTLSHSATTMARLCLFGISPSSCGHYKW